MYRQITVTLFVLIVMGFGFTQALADVQDINGVPTQVTYTPIDMDSYNKQVTQFQQRIDNITAVQAKLVQDFADFQNTINQVQTVQAQAVQAQSMQSNQVQGTTGN
jgi:hypothetical protein